MRSGQPGFRNERGCRWSPMRLSWDWRKALSCLRNVGWAKRSSLLQHFFGGIYSSAMVLIIGGIFSAGLLNGQEAAHSYAVVGVLRTELTPDDLALNTRGEKKAKALALYFRGLMYEDAVDTLEALHCFQEVIKLDPVNVELTLETANLAAAYGKFDDAIQILEESLRLNPDRPEAYVNLSQFCDTFHNGRKDFDERAVTHGREAFERFPYDPDVCEHYTRVLMSRKREAVAVEALEKTISVTTHNPYFWLQMGRIARTVYPPSSGDPNRDKVNAIYEKAIEAAPENADVLRRVGDFFSITRQYPKAREIYEEIVEKNPEKLEIRERLVRVYRAMDQMELAMDALQELVRINPHREKTQALLAEMLEKSGNQDDAIAHMEQLLKLRDGEIPEYHRLFELLLEAKDLEKALKVARKGLSLHPASVVMSVNISRALTLLNRYEESLVQWKETERLALERGEDLQSEFYFSYAMAADKAKEMEKAEELLGKSIHLATENEDDEAAAESLNYLGYMWLENGTNVDEAEPLIRRALQFVPESAAFIDTLGWFHFKKGDYAQALEQLLKAVELVEEPDSVIFDHVAQTYLKLGKSSDAESYFRKALELDPENGELKKRLDGVATSNGGQEAT